MVSCQFQESCKNYTKSCDVRLLVECSHYHANQLALFTKKFQETFLCRLAKPTIYEKSLFTGVPVYAYSPQALYNAIVTELRSLCKYSYSFISISSLVTKAMSEEQIPASLLIVMSEYRTVSESFVTPLTESCIWSAEQRPTFVLLSKGFVPPKNWVNSDFKG